MTDTYRHKGLRNKLIESLRNKRNGLRVTDERILEVMNQIPRHFFMDRAFEEQAYKDKAFPIGCDQTISQPFTVAFQTQLLEVKKRDKILEIGTGSGYQAAVLASLGARVFTIERQEGLFQKTRKLLDELGFQGIRMYFKDGYLGLPEFAPFDKILVTAGAPQIPEKLLSQLKVGGIMVIPVGIKAQKMLKITRIAEKEYEKENWGDFRFVPFLEGIAKK